MLVVALGLIAAACGSRSAQSDLAQESAAQPHSPVVESPAVAVMPDVEGYDLTNAKLQLRSDPDFDIAAINVIEETTSDQSVGTVIYTRPLAGTTISDPTSLEITIYVAKAYTPGEVAESVTQEFGFGGGWAILGDGDGYLIAGHRHVGFGRTLAIDVAGSGSGAWKPLARAVEDNRPALEALSFTYVVMAFPNKEPSNVDTIVMGFSLKDWTKYGTWRQPQYPTLGLIKNDGIRFSGGQ